MARKLIGRKRDFPKSRMFGSSIWLGEDVTFGAGALQKGQYDADIDSFDPFVDPHGSIIGAHSSDSESKDSESDD